MTALRLYSVHEMPLKERVVYVKNLKNILSGMSLESSEATLRLQWELLLHNQEVQRALKEISWLRQTMHSLTLEKRYALGAFLAIGEGIRCLKSDTSSSDKMFHELLSQLINLEHLYKMQGGIIGYHLLCLEQMIQDEPPLNNSSSGPVYSIPPAIDIRQKTPLIRQSIVEALHGMHTMAECYVVGGAAERLQCVNLQTGKPLAAALFPFGGLPGLLTWLLRDLAAREGLASKLTGLSFVTPVVLMTSLENHEAVMQFCCDHQWFGRPSEYFLFVKQPLVPVLTERGEWVIEGPMQLHLKASGHGALWTQLEQAGLLQSLQTMGVRKVLVRQINNPFCGLDHGILAFVGLGLLRDKAFGFASCERKTGAAEGMNVLRKLHVGDAAKPQSSYCITNIEYTQLKKSGIEEVSQGEGSPNSVFPANTNILFADLSAIEKALKKNSLPGLLLNMKTKIAQKDEKGQEIMLHAGRLESTMQNIADDIVDVFSEEQTHLQWDSLSTYLTYNARDMTLSVVKNAFQEGKDPFGTPPACFYELQIVLRRLLVEVCHMDVPILPPLDVYLKSQVPFWLQLSPRLGPLYSLIAGKIVQGFMGLKAHLVLELTNLWMNQVSLQGSLQVYAETVGSCLLECVRINNRGALYSEGKHCWKGDFLLEESCKIIIEGDGVFCAKHVVLEGNLSIYVRAGTCVTAYQDADGALLFKIEALTGQEWRAPLQFTSEGEITCGVP